MRFPPLFIGAVTVYWGFSTGFEYLAIIMAALFELSRVLKIKFELKDTDFIRISDLSSIVMLILLLYSYLENEPREIFLFFITTTPIVFMPLLFAQLYSTKEKVVIGTKFGKKIHAHAPIDVRPLYFITIFLATAIAGSKEIWFFVFTFAFAFILLSGSVKNITSLINYTLSSALTVVLTLLIALGIMFAHKAIKEKMMEIYRNWYNQQSTDPFKSATAIGERGYLKLSGNILMRIIPSENEKPPIYLKSSDYNILIGNIWYSRSGKSTPVLPDGDMEWQFFGDGAGKKEMVISTWMGKGGKGVLSLPAGSKRGLKMDVAGIEKGALGSIVVEEGPDLLEFIVTYDKDFRGEPPPKEKDFQIPDDEKEVVAKIMEQNSLIGRTDEETIKNIKEFFSKFSYTLQLESSSKKSVLEKFFNETKAGHCEYFATATVLMLRHAGIAARYSTGFSVDEYSSLEKAFVARGRDAHAWVTAFVDGKWINIETTPSSWRFFDSRSKSFFEPVKDFFAWAGIGYEKFRRQKNVELNRTLIVVATLLTLFMMIKIYIRRKRVFHSKNKEKQSQKIVEGANSPFYAVLEQCIKEGVAKSDNESLRKWFYKNIDKLRNPKEIFEMLTLHEELRFNPDVKKAEKFKKLQKKESQWRKELS